MVVAQLLGKFRDVVPRLRADVTVVAQGLGDCHPRDSRITDDVLHPDDHVAPLATESIQVHRNPSTTYKAPTGSKGDATRCPYGLHP